MDSIRNMAKKKNKKPKGKDPETASETSETSVESEPMLFRNRLAVCSHELVDVGLVYESLMEMSPFRENMVYGTDVTRLQFAIFHLMRNTYNPSKDFLNQHPELRISNGNKIPEAFLFERIREITKIDGWYDDPDRAARDQVQATLAWIMDTLVNIMKDFVVFKIFFEDSGWDVHDMTADEWRENCVKVATAINEEYGIDRANVFFTQELPAKNKSGKAYPKVFIVSDQIYDIVMDNKDMSFDLEFVIDGCRVATEVREPGVCAWPWANKNTGHIESVYECT